MCVGIVISWRHSSTNCVVAILSIGLTLKSQSPTCNGLKLSIKRLAAHFPLVEPSG